MLDSRRNELLDLVLKYNQQLREETRGMSLEDTVFFLESLRTSIKGAEDVFRKGLEREHANGK